MGFLSVKKSLQFHALFMIQLGIIFENLISMRFHLVLNDANNLFLMACESSWNFQVFLIMFTL